MGKTITEHIQAFTERGTARRTWNGSTSIVDQNVSVDNVLSNPHRNNGVSKVLSILLSDFLSRGSEHSLWRHHGLENKQLKSAQCQRKASAVSGSHICTVWHSAGISGKCRDIGIDFSGIAAWLALGLCLRCYSPNHLNEFLRCCILRSTDYTSMWRKFNLQSLAILPRFGWWPDV